MKTLSFVILSVIIAVAASPLGDHAIFRRHNGAQPLARRYILESRMNVPPQCASVSGSAPSLVPPSSGPSVTNVAIPSGLTLPSNLFPTGAALNGASNAVPTAGGLITGGSAIPAGPSKSRRSISSFELSEESTFSSFVETWETLCLSSGGDIYTNDPCSRLAGFAGIDALLEFANPCDQQHIADSMITFAKSKGIRNKDSLIKFALQYRKHYRNSVEILGVIPSSFYCMERPINPELVGVYHAQISGAHPGIFGSPISPLVPFGSVGTCPLGTTTDMSTCACVTSASSGGSTSSNGSSSGGSLPSNGSTDASASALATDSSNITATATDSSNVSAIATDSSNVTATATDSSASTATAAVTDSSNLTATAAATDSASLASATVSNTVTATDSAALASATVAATNTFSTGVNVQPTNISGDVNNPAGR